MKNEEKTQIKTSGSPDVVHSVDESRRSFSKKGLIAPVIMTLANRSAWGGTNMCTESGFKSFAAPGAILSHVAHVKNSGWKTPAGWASEPNWPAGANFGKATKRLPAQPTRPGAEIVFDSPLWSTAKNLRQVIRYERDNSPIKIMAKSFDSTVSDPNLTILAALSGDNLLAFQIATVLNNAVSPLPPSFLMSNPTLADYQTFYANCVG